MDHLKEKQQKPLDEIDQMLSEFTVLSADELLGEFTPPSAAKAEPNTVQKTAVPPAEPEPLSPTEEPASQQAAETETIIEPEEQEETPAAMPESEEGPENWEALSVEDMFRALETEKPGGEAIQEPPEERVPEERVERAVKGAAAPARRETEQPPPKREEPRSNAAAGTAVAVEAVVASTVDSVLAERKDEERRYQKQRRKNQHQQEKMHRSNSDRAMDTVDFSAAEPSLAEATIRQKRRFRRLRKAATITSALALVAWVPVVLAAFGVEIPYYSEIPMVSAVVQAVLQAAACGVGWSVFSLAVSNLVRGRVTCHLAVALCNIVTLLDTATAPLFVNRLAAASLGGISMVALALDLWGECWHAGALKEGFRLVALGRPAYVVDLTENGAVKQSGPADGFYNRTVREDEAMGWQSLLLPVILVASVVFGALASFGQGQRSNFLWCWSAILTAGTALSLPFTYSLPYFRLAKRLGKSGCAVAGFYGARQLSYSREILVGDEDLFPAGTMKMAGMKLIAEDRRKVAAYAGSLARVYGGTWPGLFEAFMQAEGATQQRLEEFHVHEEGGVSAIIRGETVILGIANLIRKMSIRLPKSLEWKDGLFLAVDGELVAIFGVVYEPADSVSWALGAMRRNRLSPLLATRDPNLQPKFLRAYFGSDGGSTLLDLEERLMLTERPRRKQILRPNALLYREGLAPFLEAVAGSRRLCRAVTAANLITLFACILGTLLAFYLMFVGRASMLTPPQLLLFLGLWMLPVLLLAWNTDRI